jgi:tetratricopeptide (TPR) repeat protein
MADRAKAETHFLRGMDALVRSNVGGAADAFLLAVQNDPSYLDALFNLGKACKDLGRLPEAADAFGRMAILSPDDTEAWYMLGNTYHAMEHYAEAERSYRTILNMNPQDVRVSINLGVTLQAAGKPREAIEVLGAALSMAPENADLHYNRALSLLVSGEYAEGWKELEWRFFTSDGANPLPAMPMKRWNGELIQGKTLLLKAEQGVGDTVQFARFISEVRRRCGKVMVECGKELLSFMRSCEGIDALIEKGQKHLPSADVWAPMMSLPFLLDGLSPQGGSPVPYLAADPEKKTRWQEYIATSRMRARVGIVWAGNPQHTNDRRRSCPPAHLTELIRANDVRWVSLQKNNGGSLPAEWGGAVIDAGPLLQDFDDTAAAIELLDLIITVDTAVAHLAGALKKPVWLLLPFAPDWRWLLERSDSPWYPTMRIFRQPEPGAWPTVIAQVSDELRKLQDSYGRSLASPGNPNQYLEYANALREAGLREHAIRIYRLVVQLDPHHLAGWNNLGITLQDAGNLTGAVEAFRKALTASPDNAVVLNNLGFALLEQGDATQAEKVFRLGLAQDASIPDLHNNLGNALRERGQLHEAIAAYRHAIRLRQEFAEPHWNLAQLLLQTGDFTAGWMEYEWRWRRPDFTSPHRNFPQPMWNGENIAGRTILVHAEQGYGDALQFVRYVPMVAAAGAKVLLECHDALVRLFTGIPGIAGVFAHGRPLPAFDVHVPMMSLPRICGTTLASIPSQVPYLRVSSAERQHWQAILDPMPGQLHVGFAWSGMRHLKSLLSRACPLEAMVPLLGTPSVEFYGLQKTVSASESAMLDAMPGVHILSDELTDFADTAAAIVNLDLVISIDTAVAHLAGALGIPTWVLLPFNADWRWLLERADSPWYPSMRLFRQKGPDDWRTVIDECRGALAEQIARPTEVQ